MTRVQQRVTALVAAFVLAIGCALVIGMPQQAHAATNTKLVAGSTFEKATNMPLTGTDLKATNYTKFNNTNDNNFYKFTTSDRNSRYKLWLRSFDGWRLYVTVYDSGHHRVANMTTTSKTGQSWMFKNLKHNSVYYVEIWRFAINVTDYIDRGEVLGEGYSESSYVPYKIAVREVITKPGEVLGLKIRSVKKGTISVRFDESDTAAGYRIEVKKGNGNWKQVKYTTKTYYVIKGLSSTSKYKVRVRSARWVNGKLHASNYTTTSWSIKANGKKTKWVA